MLSNLLFETPWWLPTSLVALGIMLFFTGNRRAEKKIMRGGIVIALLGIAIALISYFVETDTEKVVSQTKQLTAAIDKRDWEKFRSLLNPKTSFYFYHNRDELVAGAKATVERIGLKSVHLTGIETEKNDTLITVNVRAYSEQDLAGPLVTDWQLEWQNFGNGWLLYSIQA